MIGLEDKVLVESKEGASHQEGWIGLRSQPAVFG